ncbi:hypothetical protein [Halorubrum laminariae]|uniref:Uncharacterized protein n=1 Tax=Halorubrum laminariae TaxID=1433523 RepID=A0ABD6BY28_9EURY|nr:hypothetical protein [Halorubrum laminariae]
MTEITRRLAIRSVVAGSVGALAGCTGGDGSDGPGSDGDGTDGGDGDDGTDGDADAPTERTVLQVESPLSGPAWDRRSRRGFCTRIAAEEDATWLLDDASEETRTFVSETDFERAVVVYVESVGPTTCHSALSFEDITIEDGTLTASVRVEDTAAVDEGCGQAITYPAAMVRIESDPRPVSVRLQVTDGWGETGTVCDDGVVDPDVLPGVVRPDGEPTAIPASFDCETEGFERHPQVYEGAVNWGGGGGVGGDGDDGSDADDAGSDDDDDAGPLALRIVSPDDERSDSAGDEMEDEDGTGGDTAPVAGPLARGDPFRIELTNVSDRPAHIGNQGKYNLELRTEAGWTEIRGTDGEGPFGYTDEAIGVDPGESLTWEFEMTESGLIEGGPHADVLRVCPDLAAGRYRFVFWGGDDLAVAFDYVG